MQARGRLSYSRSSVQLPSLLLLSNPKSAGLFHKVAHPPRHRFACIVSPMIAGAEVARPVIMPAVGTRPGALNHDYLTGAISTGQEPAKFPPALACWFYHTLVLLNQL